MNWLDFSIVTLWFVGVLGMGVGAQVQFARVIRLAKVLRLLKLLRFAEGIDSLVMMTTALKDSIATLGWTIGIISSALTFFALLMTQALGQFYLQDPSQPFEQRQLIWAYFGTFT